MPAFSQSPRVWRYLRRIRTFRIVLQYDRHVNDLVPWHWPTNERGERVTPSDLEEHRQSHHFVGPCCLCPMRRGEDYFTEAAVVMVARGELSGEYVAQCARNMCGYFVYMERIHARQGIPVRAYAPRGVNSPAPEPVVLEDDNHRQAVQVRRASTRGLTDAITRRAPPRQTTSAIDWLFRLDSVLNPGLTKAELRRLLVTCTGCGNVMTKRVFPSHTCIELAQVEEILVQDDEDVMDLTGDD